MRGLALVLVAFAAWSASRPPPERGAAAASGSALADSLDRWTATAPARVHLALETAPNGARRDWLRALRYSGTPVAWHNDGAGIPALALEVAPVAGPRGGTMLSIAAPSGSRVVIGDAIAAIDSVVAARGGARLFAPIATGPVTAVAGGQRASATVADTLLPRRVLVLGRATWEAKFLISALEEVGWPVDARLTVAPGVEVTQGTSRVPDTARHAAVVVLDAPPPGAAAAVARYVRAGGGTILAGAAASAPGLAEIAAGRVGARIRPSSIVFVDDRPRQALGFRAIAPRGDAIVLEEQNGVATAAARRVDAGRVVQLGYDETWRWRLAGGTHALEAHRTWWSALVSSVAYRAAARLPREVDDAAPLAALIHGLGPPGAAALVAPARALWSPSPALLFALVSLLLVAELASRRMRGAP